MRCRGEPTRKGQWVAIAVGIFKMFFLNINNYMLPPRSQRPPIAIGGKFSPAIAERGQQQLTPPSSRSLPPSPAALAMAHLSPCRPGREEGLEQWAGHDGPGRANQIPSESVRAREWVNISRRSDACSRQAIGHVQEDGWFLSHSSGGVERGGRVSCPPMGEPIKNVVACAVRIL